MSEYNLFCVAAHLSYTETEKERASIVAKYCLVIETASLLVFVPADEKFTLRIEILPEVSKCQHFY